MMASGAQSGTRHTAQTHAEAPALSTPNSWRPRRLGGSFSGQAFKRSDAISAFGPPRTRLTPSVNREKPGFLARLTGVMAPGVA